MKRVLSVVLAVLMLSTVFLSTPVVASAVDNEVIRTPFLYNASALTASEQKLLDVETNKLLEGIKGNTSLTEVEKALLIHDRLALTCSYDFKFAKTSSTAYGAIVLKKAVCQGYALAYQYLLGLVGIKSEYVSSKYLDHGWNLVYINNVPYHVDVTWDDPDGYAEEGKVYHDNFLRSTGGMIETGHKGPGGSIDYNSTPNNTTYDKYFWQNSSTSFQLLNNEIYYLDNLNKKIMKLNKTDGSDATLIKDVPAKWKFTEQGGKIDSFARLASDGSFLYYTTPNQVIKLNPTTKETSVEYTLTLPSEYVGKDNVDCSLWGLSFENCTFTYEYIIFVFGALDSEWINKKVTKSNHVKSDWIVDKNPNCGNAGSKHIECTACKTVLETASIPANGTHVPGDLTTLTNSTQSTTGVAVKKCKICNAELERVSIPKIPTVKIANSANGITVTWNAVEGAQSYVVYRRTYNPSTKKYSGWTTLNGAYTSTSYTDTKVVLGTQYSYTVRAVNDGVKSAYKATSGLKYNVTPTVKVSNATNGIKVTWTTAANADGYRVYRSTYNSKTKKWSSWKNMGTAKATATSWTDKSVSNNTYYKYTVRAVEGKFLSSYKASSQTRFFKVPTVKIANNASGVKVTWSKISGATSYIVYRSEFVNGKWSSWKTLNSKATSTSYTDKTVKSGVQYKYTVRAVNGSYKSAYVSSSTLLYLAQPTVTVANASNGIKVSWTQSEGAMGYTVYSSTYNTKTKKWSSWTNRGTAKATSKSWTDKKAKKGTTYRYTVRAVNGSAKSTYTASSSIKR